MRAIPAGLGLLGSLALAGVPVAARAQPVEFQSNTYTTSHQFMGGGRGVAADASENFVVVWTSDGQDGSDLGVFGQRYDSDGVALGSEFQVNSFTTSFQDFPSVAAVGANRFVVAWSSFGQDGDGDGVFGRRLRARRREVDGR